MQHPRKHSGSDVTNAPCGRGSATPLSCQGPPVELNAVTRPARRDRVTVVDLQRLRNIAFKSEPMGFQVTAVGTGGEQMHGEALSTTGAFRRLGTASGSRRSSETCSPGSERKRDGCPQCAYNSRRGGRERRHRVEGGDPRDGRRVAPPDARHQPRFTARYGGDCRRRGHQLQETSQLAQLRNWLASSEALNTSFSIRPFPSVGVSRGDFVVAWAEGGDAVSSFSSSAPCEASMDLSSGT